MKPENTLENKAKFFAQYWGQEVFRKFNWNLDARPNYPSWDVDEQSVREPELEFAYLELKPLQDITDEDAIEVARILDIDIESLCDGEDEVDGISRSKDCVSINFWYRCSHEYEEYDITGHEICRGNKLTLISNTMWGIPDPHKSIEVSDYLRSKGYALPWMDLSVEDQIEYGWVKIKE